MISLKEYLVYSGIVFLLFYVLFTGLFRNRKIQQKFPKFKDYRRDFTFSLITISIFATIALLVWDRLMGTVNKYSDQVYKESTERKIIPN